MGRMKVELAAKVFIAQMYENRGWGTVVQWIEMNSLGSGLWTYSLVVEKFDGIRIQEAGSVSMS